MDDHKKFELMLKMLLMLARGRAYSVKELSEKFERSERSIFRFMATFREAGFIVECNDGLYQIPKLEKPFKSIGELLHFSEEEAYILTRAIHSIDDNNLLKTNLINKLYALYDFDRVADTVVKPGNIETVHRILEAIRRRKQTLFRQYRSAHGNLVRDRMVEPFGFTINYTYVWAFEPESGTCKMFKTSRISSVQVLEQEWKNETLHEKDAIDVFRISSKQQLRVVLRLSLRAYNLLIEEYPLAEKHLTELDDNYWQLDTKVCSFDGVGRFVLGLCDEVEIIEPIVLKDFILQKTKKIK